MTVRASHAIAEEASETIRARLPRANVTVHVEPCDGRCDEDACDEGCLLPEDARGKARHPSTAR
jgi:hypothetical protein